MPTRILFLYANTGGGHRSAAEAIRDAILQEWPGRAEIILGDSYVDGLPRPLNKTGSFYGPLVESRWGWKTLWQTGEVPGMVDALWKVLPLNRFRALIQRYSPDVVVSVHPIANRPMALTVRAMPRPIPCLCVVTDLVEGSAMWFDKMVDFTYVPTEAARAKAMRVGVPYNRIEVVGQPVHPRFHTFEGDRVELRAQLGLVPDRPAVLVVGGGEGMGRVYDISRAIATSGLRVQLVIIAGRNASLKAQLDAVRWEAPTIVKGFVTNMPDWMHAVDVLVTKAGPGTIAEGLIAGRPLLLSGFVPGQEESNVKWVVSQGLGVAAMTPEAVVTHLREWLIPGNTVVAEMRRRALTLARPHAARDLGERILAWSESGQSRFIAKPAPAKLATRR